MGEGEIVFLSIKDATSERSAAAAAAHLTDVGGGEFAPRCFSMSRALHSPRAPLYLTLIPRRRWSRAPMLGHID